MQRGESMIEIMTWLVLLILFIAVEAGTLGLTSIWFAGGALIALVIAAIGGPVWLQLLFFLAVSLVLLFFTRPVAMKYFNRERVKTNVESVVGKQAVVTVGINNLQGTGTVVLAGQEWTARSCEEGIVIPEGAVVVVEAVSGVKLMVRELKKTE